MAEEHVSHYVDVVNREAGIRCLCGEFATINLVGLREMAFLIGMEDMAIPRKLERLNPVCPVCGEDEPGMDLYTKYDPETIGKHVVPIGSELGCGCRRCGWSWSIEPLSKPWEEEK